MIVNNPPVFNRLIASGGEQITAEIDNDLIQLLSDSVDTDVITSQLVISGSTRLKIATYTGQWNMDAVNTIFVNISQSVTSFLHAFVTIYNNANTNAYAYHANGVSEIYLNGAGQIVLSRFIGGIFDNTGYNNAFYRILVLYNDVLS